MKVLVFCEDPRLDRYLLKPIVEAALHAGGDPHPKVFVCQDISQRGESTVLSSSKLLDLIRSYPLFETYILCVDRDCQQSKSETLSFLERVVTSNFPAKRLITVAAIEELEVWALSAARDLDAPWETVRSDCHPKEAFFEPYVTRMGIDGPGRGRKRLGEEAAKLYSKRLSTLCPEVKELEKTVLP